MFGYHVDKYDILYVIQTKYQYTIYEIYESDNGDNDPSGH